MKDFWIIGDMFVNQVYHMLPEIRNKVKHAKKEIPYLYQYYNVSCFATNLLSILTNTMTRIYNALIKAFNDFQKMP